MASSGLDVAGAVPVDQGDRQIAEGGQNLWGVARPQARPIFAKGDIAHIMGALFDTPMPPVEC